MGNKVRWFTVNDARAGVGFTCPGCGLTHNLPTDPAGTHWTFNGDVQKPTLSPSILARNGHYVPGFKVGSDACWCTWADEDGDPSPFGCGVCHSFVVEGRIQFLSDSTHALAGQTVDLPDIEES